MELTPERIVERERRWALPAAISCFLPIVLFIVSFLIISGSDVSSGGDAAELRSIHEHAGRISAAVLVQGVAFLAMAPALLYLFLAASARSPRVQRAFAAFAILGPLLFAVQSVAQGFAFRSIASDFVSQPAAEEVKFGEVQTLISKQPDAVEKVTLYTDADKLDVERQDGSFVTASYPSNAEDGLKSKLGDQSIDAEEISDGETGDALAKKLKDDSSGLAIAQDLLFPALLAMVFAVIYTALQAMRAGLLTRFFGTLGMAFGASLILLGQPSFVALWLVWLGLVILGRSPGGQPPAWQTGEAIPWPKPGEEPESPSRGDPTAVEGTGTDVTEGSAEPIEPGTGRRKRKRRR